MAEERVRRRLAAILAADVVGYSRLVREDEEATLAAVKSHISGIFEPGIASHGGRIFKTMGDAVFAEFASVVDAVRCAVGLQRELAKRNADTPVDRRIEFRIGVNLGDVVTEGEDIHGDGVNVVARLQSLAEPGGICISEDAYRHLGGRLEVGYEDLGPLRLKNIDKPVRVYRVLTDTATPGRVVVATSARLRRWKWPAVAAAVVFLALLAAGYFGVFPIRPPGPEFEPASVERMAFPLPEKPSIAVLPFDNLSGDPEQEHLADGITEAIITALSRVPNLFVIARNSTFTYKGKPVKVQQVAEELGVRYVLEGSVQRSGKQVRITAQLVDALSGHHLWAEQYDREVSGIFELQDDITQRVVTELEVKLTEGEMARLRRRQTDSAKAYERFLVGLERYKHFCQGENLEAQQLFASAAELDPDFAAAYSLMGWTNLKQARLGYVEDTAGARERAVDFANRALAIDETNVDALTLMAEIHVDRKEFDEAFSLYEKALAYNPNHADALANLGWRLSFPSVGRADEGLVLIKRAMRLSPFYPNAYLGALGTAYYALGQYDKAIAAFEERRKRIPDSWLPYAYLAFTYSEAGRMDEASESLAKLLERNPKFTVGKFARLWGAVFAAEDHRDRAVANLRKAGLPE